MIPGLSTGAQYSDTGSWKGSWRIKESVWCDHGCRGGGGVMVETGQSNTITGRGHRRECGQPLEAGMGRG